MGRIIRNHLGNVHECGMDKFEGRHAVEEGESTALIWAMQATFSLGYKKVIFEGDNIHVNKCIQGQAYNLRFTQFIHTIVAWKNHFEAIQFVYRNRASNSCADLLARKSINSENLWSVPCLSEIFNLQCNDRSISI